ncbi:MAG: hypothetical protein CL610_17705 [Anaerolineaceae bacterium]|nr:hypothetical protein [Anaerolineaceae bacterium]
MPNTEIELKPVDFITVGTIGPKGRRMFHLQAGKGNQIVSLVIEKEQAWALSEAVKELIDDLDERYPNPDGKPTEVDMDTVDMELREPIEPIFRVSQMGLGYDEDNNMIVLVAQELVPSETDTEPDEPEPGIVRMWCDRSQMRALSLQAISTVQSGRADPRQNGRVVYYWT